MVSPVYSIILIVVGVLLLIGVAVLTFVCGVLAWQSWALVKVNRIVGESIAVNVELLKQFPAKFDAIGVFVAAKLEAIGVVVAELKGFEEGELKLIERLVKAVVTLDRTVEEFQACIIAPADPTQAAPRRAYRSSEVSVATEGDELVREKQRQERKGTGIPEDADFGRNVATV